MLITVLDPLIILLIILVLPLLVVQVMAYVQEQIQESPYLLMLTTVQLTLMELWNQDLQIDHIPLQSVTT